MESLVTVVLPVHNAERSLRGTVHQILELVETTPRRLQLAIVDDGSTDGTYEAACELACEFPQVRVVRLPHRRGLGAALERVRQCFGARELIAHDGVGPIDVDQLTALLRASGAHGHGSGSVSGEAEGGRRRFSAVAALDARLAAAHRAVIGCHWQRFQEPSTPRRKTSPLAPAMACDSLGSPASWVGSNTCTSGPSFAVN